LTHEDGGFSLDGVQLAPHTAFQRMSAEKTDLPEALASVGKQCRRWHMHVLLIKLLDFAPEVGNGDEIGAAGMGQGVVEPFHIFGCS
jgi:hypothetical protein